jgi:hypothetical protein
MHGKDDQFWMLLAGSTDQKVGRRFGSTVQANGGRYYSGRCNGPSHRRHADEDGLFGLVEQRQASLE